MNSTNFFLNWLLGFSTLWLVWFGSAAKGFSIQPTQIHFDDKVPWSEVVQDPQLGLVVHDRHYTLWHLNGMNRALHYLV